MENITTKIIETVINTKLNHSLLTILNDIYNNITQKEQEKLDKILIENNYIQKLKAKINVTLTKDVKEDSLRLLKSDDNRKCISMIKKGRRCTRNKFQNSDYCGLHVKMRQQQQDQVHDQAQVTQDQDQDQFQEGQDSSIRTPRIQIQIHKREIKPRRRRGPNKKQLNEIDASVYIKAAEMVIDGTNYLVDEYGVVFSNDRENLIMGYISDDMVNWIS